jgi:hypothetical protein
MLTTLRGITLAVGVVFLFANPAFGVTAPTTVTWSPAATSELPFPLLLGTETTTFTTYSVPIVSYASGTFFVGTTGTYSATLASPTNDVILYLLTGTFTPGVSIPTTPLSSYFAGELNVFTVTIPTVTLQAGVQYSYLTALSVSGTGTGTLTLSGPGCISFGSNCAVLPVPTLEPGAFALLAILVAVSGMFLLKRRERTQA